MTATNADPDAILAVVVERFVKQIDFSALTISQKHEALRELSSLRPMLAKQSPRLAAGLAQLEEMLRVAAPNPRPNRANAKRLKHLLRLLAPLAMSAIAAGTIGASPAFAAIMTPPIGGNVFNPLTQSNETVIEIIGSGYAVRTSSDNIIFLATSVNDTYSTVADGVTTTYTVTAVTTTTYGAGADAVSYVTGVTTKTAANVSASFSVVNSATYTVPSPGGDPGSGSSTLMFTPPMGNEQFQDIRAGSNGGGGRDGGGVNLCIPFTSICAFAGVPPTAGGAGASGPAFSSAVAADALGDEISSKADGLSGIKIASIGGNGGAGGDSFSLGGYSGQPGGAAGNGGNVTGANRSVVSTGGNNSYGMWVFSQAGSGGSGGNGYILTGGGSGGTSASGGSATGNNYASLTTQGENAVGLLVQSLGGAGGSGGSSYGLVGSAGSGSVGGDGGDVTALNDGRILTKGKFAFGVQAQSIGGSGGNSGDSGGLAAFGATAGGAGTGGNSTVSLDSKSDITTVGDFAHGVFAQSIGGGGGSTGVSGGLVSFGSAAGAGGTGGGAAVNASSGSKIETRGIGAFGIFAESVGGNGGTAAGTGGVYTLGGSGGSGNIGGTVDVDNGGSILTTGVDARGIFAQSVGGGGGLANASGGVVSLGGSGGAGANGGTVSVTLQATSTIETRERGADGVFVQSVGGGGGAGAASGGVVALGGSGSVGGEGGTVLATNAGDITTSGVFSRGLFAQSIGGGGGSGGDGAGLAAIGGGSSVASRGGDVTIGNSGTVTTKSNVSTALQGQSIGGGGGDGGTSGGVLLNIGGSGSGGGAGGIVTAKLSGRLQTSGNDSHGLFAQSVGGGGGNGGSATSVSVFAGLALGGSGSGGGAGGAVTAVFAKRGIDVSGSSLLVNPLITTDGDRSRGVYLQSIGGGGGSGGMAVQVSVGVVGAASFAIGGSGGAGGDGGVVNASGGVQISTTGLNSEGFFAQSVGGGGGNGGVAVSVAASGGIGASGALSIGIGGSGGSGGDGGQVMIDSGGGIATSGQYSTGFVAQSVGGGGGKGGFSVSVAGAGSAGAAVSGGLGIGGSGGAGGAGGLVNATFDGAIATGGLDGLGTDSVGALIQSVGGGGGSGGFNVTAAIQLGGGSATGAAVGLGGSGGLGGLGGQVTGTIGKDVTTRGARSTGVLIQSTGGGGGSGGFNISGNIGLSGGFSGGATVGLGGSGDGGGAGGRVAGSALGKVNTYAAQSDGVVIQSIGGGGGSGGFNVSGNLQFGGATALAIGVGLGGSGGGAGAGGTVTGTVDDQVSTSGNQSRGVLVQSVGGGGGAGAFNITGGIGAGGAAGGTIGVGLGGNAGGGGSAGVVVARAKSVYTTGNDSAGFIAQSIGGGGGVGGFNVTGGLGFGGTGAGTISIGLGGSGGSGGSAGTVTANLTGIASTQGNRSGAILAQSVGGGGGSGAFNISAGITAAGTGSGSLNIGLGGTGETPGNGDEVALTVDGNATTDGVDSYGVIAQSLGGGGGSGGFNVSGGIAVGGAGAGQIGFGLGGRGGGGGDAGTVTLNLNALATTSDDARLAAATKQNNSTGILAQSLGGGGGNGGFNVTGGASFGGTGAGGLNIGVGGSAGGGGNASNVFANIGGATSTLGDDSIGVLAQSVGGGGGNGGFNVSGGLTYGGAGSGAVNVGVGGGGGKGGGAGDVTLRINDQIVNPERSLIAATSMGDRSSGVVAQSLGGGGGNGGFNVTGGINLAGTGAGSANIGVGGTGGKGGRAGSATADITGGISTAGLASTGLLVQSVGGGGGNGGFDVSGALSIAKTAGGIGVGIGGFGGDGGKGGAATLDFNQRTADPLNILAGVTSVKDDSAGIIVQSLGGGGGNGGFNVTGAMAFSSEGAGNIDVGVGGFGGGGGDGAVARANVRGDLVTGGDRSGALLVQSMGGGGGNGGFNVTAGIAVSKGGSGNLGFGLGGFGGDGGDGKAVFVTVESDISTAGNESYGANIQSLGGGGGNGAFNVTGGIAIGLGESLSANIGIGIGGFGGGGGGGDEVTASLTGNVQTSGGNSHGILVQSAGGGGGNGGFNVSGGFSATKGSSGSFGFGLGGFGGDGGDGEKVTATVSGNVLTNLNESYGAMFQSLGGGGGNGAFNVSGGINISPGENGAGNLNVGIGGFGGGGGKSGAVIGSLTGNIQTSGNDAFGVLMQSLGGGGGNGGFNVSGGVALAAGATGTIGFGIGGFGGAGGDADTVNGLTNGNVTTGGIGSYGALFQSLGGAGGTGALNVTGGITITKGDPTSGGVSIGIGGFGGGGGDGARVTAEARGLYVTNGADSAGVVAQSVGGGGGSGGLNVSGSIGISTQGTGGGAALGLGGFGGDGGSSGDVSLNRVGQTITQVRNSDGVVAQSIGGGGGRGGLNVSGGISATNNGNAGSLVIGVGGFGGAGGKAGAVAATILDSVRATGSDAPGFVEPGDFVLDDGSKQPAGRKTRWAGGSNGIVVESIGGGGGSGVLNISGGISAANSANASIAKALVLGIGGFGGSGGDAGNVTATIGRTGESRIQVQSQGDKKSAIFIASIGGGGGDGGINVSGAITTSGQVVAGFGGAGSGGGLGKQVMAHIDADLFAKGFQASGLTVQSLGGGGGSGAINISGGLKVTARTQPVIALGMGGDGGAGNSSGSVDVRQDGQVVVEGFNSNGILVQSVAGGGGAGGFNVTGVLNRSDGNSQYDGFAAGIGVGGTGGTGAVAGDAYLRSTGNILINSVVEGIGSGANLVAGAEAGLSSGVTVQSIGGGGGVGGFNLNGVIAPSGNPLTIAVGGGGGVGADAGNVTVVRGLLQDGSVSRSLISTFGFQSMGLIAQSIGGGGGNAGTNLSFAYGSTQPSKTGFGGQFVIGGDGQSSGNGKTVFVDHAGDIQTSGAGSHAILAQSIGKGGGNAAINIGVAKVGLDTPKGADPSGEVNGFSLALGGAAGNAGSAGDVTVNHDGKIVVRQVMSTGIVAQSLAGGGGNTALNIGALVGSDNVLKMAIGRSGGQGGRTGNVVVTAKGSILAAGAQSNGIVAQSIGGAGGLSGTIQVEGQIKNGSDKSATKSGFAVAVGLEGGAGGRAGTVTIDNQADIETDGESARGIIAQSIGGDGGVAGSARTLTSGQADSVAVAIGGGGGSGATSSTVTVGNTGIIMTSGKTSDGILSQSVGGGGGVAGSASTINVLSVKKGEEPAKQSLTVALAVGGSGGDGAIGGDVKVINDGVIVTKGETSFGIRAQSIGGGGGVGGAVYNVQRQEAKDPSTLNVLIGGGGGDGQAAGRVEVINRGLIMTTGLGASAISANSIGGGGGDAGSVANLTYVKAADDTKSNAFQLAIGGAGGAGGTGGDIFVMNSPTAKLDSGTILTTAANAHGIFAQSLGGGGGNGSSILSLAISNGAKDSVSIGLNLGGFGGAGNRGGNVTVGNDGIIRTKGDGSIGILAQSIGGGGGNGGVVLSANLLLKSKDKSPLVSIGGIGGAGNDGGRVVVINNGRIITEGKNADGIVAQSIGGGGGNAGLGVALTGEVRTLVGSNLLSLLVGAVGGGKSGLGGQVDVTHTGDITVLGAGSQAIVAESINGGGGGIKFDLSGITVPSISAAIPGLVVPSLGEIDGIPSLVAGEPVNRPVNPVIVAARVGASDASKLNGGKVNVSITGTLGVGGDYGAGATIRSVGGGGGSIVLSGTLVMPEPLPEPEAVMGQFVYVVGLGAKNSSESSGAAIASTHDGTIMTIGKAAPGVLLQSIGGGGGSALVNLQTENIALIDSVRLGLGAVGTSNSSGGDVSRRQTGAVFTTQTLSHGALVQSIGGGGGVATGHVGLVDPQISQPVSVSGVQLLSGKQPTVAAALSAPPAPAVIVLGANGGAGNDGGVVNLSFTGGFTTTGTRAIGLIAQSIGAGGGEIALDGLTARSIILGGQAGASGSGGAVTVSNNGQVFTQGLGASGILLQSIGGGGGVLFGAGANPSLTLSSTNSGNGGAVSLGQAGDVRVLGASAFGILAQSLGGGGGVVDGVFAGTSGGAGGGGAVTLAINGQVFTPGAGSTAIAAQSLGSLGGGDIGIDALGAVRGGSGSGVGVLIDGGRTNVFTSRTELSAVSGLAVVGTSGDDTVINKGLAVGNFRLGGGSNALINSAGATLVTINSINLRDGAGSNGTFINSGNLQLGLSASKYPLDFANGALFPAYVSSAPMTDMFNGTSVISSVALNGNLRFTSTSSSLWDVAYGPYASDKISTTGNATVNGTADVVVTWLQDNKPLALISTGGTATDDGLKVTDTLALDYHILTTPNAINLAFTSNFGLPFLNRNERAIGASLDSALIAGDSAGLGRVLALLGNLSAGQESVYKSIMAELDPGMFLAPQLIQFDSARQFGADVLGCRESGYGKHNACTWGYVSTNRYTRGTEGGEYRFSQTAGNRMRMGVETRFGAGFKFGAALGYDELGEMHYDGSRAQSFGEALQAGVALAKSFGDRGRGSASVSVTGGFQTIDQTRRQTVFVAAVGTSRYTTDYVGATVKFGYSFDKGPMFARPTIEASMIRLGQQRFTERGLAGLGITGLDHGEWFGTIAPKIVVGARLGQWATVSINGGGVFHDKADISAPLRLIGANPDADPALIRTRFDHSAWTGGMDLVVAKNEKVSVDFGYRGEFGRSVTSHNANLTLKVKF